MSRPMPRTPTPSLDVPLLDGGTWRLADRSPERFTMIVAYRGLHCPVCTAYIKDLDRHLAEFEKRGVDTLAVSSDTEARARQARENWQIERLAIGYGMSIETAREWGLYISTSRGKTSIGIEEPAVFSEPGLFLVRPDGTLFGASIITMPFARPHFRDVLGALDFVIANDYPARGEA